MIITLCGSTKFMQAFNDWNAILTLSGHVVYSLAHGITRIDQNRDDEVKRRLDLIHLQKISNSDAILVLNIDGYYGETTTREIEWAKMHRKDIYWLDNKPDHLILGPSIGLMQNLFDDYPINESPSTFEQVSKYL